MTKLSLLNCVPYVPTCQRALLLTCSRAKVQACLRANVSCVLTCSRSNVPCVLFVPTCSRTVTTNNKNKFSIICFPYIFCDCYFFFQWNETVLHCCIALTRRNPLTGTTTDFVQQNGLISSNCCVLFY